jgi:hypothetical protein
VPDGRVAVVPTAAPPNRKARRAAAAAAAANAAAADATAAAADADADADTDTAATSIAATSIAAPGNAAAGAATGAAATPTVPRAAAAPTVPPADGATSRRCHQPTVLTVPPSRELQAGALSRRHEQGWRRGTAWAHRFAAAAALKPLVQRQAEWLIWGSKPGVTAVGRQIGGDGVAAIATWEVERSLFPCAASVRPRPGHTLVVRAAPSDAAEIVGVLPDGVAVEVYDGHGGLASDRSGEAAAHVADRAATLGRPVAALPRAAAQKLCSACGLTAVQTSGRSSAAALEKANAAWGALAGGSNELSSADFEAFVQGLGNEEGTAVLECLRTPPCEGGAEDAWLRVRSPNTNAVQLSGGWEARGGRRVGFVRSSDIDFAETDGRAVRPREETGCLVFGACGGMQVRVPASPKRSCPKRNCTMLTQGLRVRVCRSLARTRSGGVVGSRYMGLV